MADGEMLVRWIRPGWFRELGPLGPRAMKRHTGDEDVMSGYHLRTMLYVGRVKVLGSADEMRPRRQLKEGVVPCP